MGFSWPDGHRIAVCLTWDVDAESPIYTRYPERAREQLSELHQRRFGPQLGVPRIFDLLQRYSLPATFYVPSYVAMMFPKLVKRLVAENYPIGLHGHLHESLDTLDERAEIEVLQTSKAILGEICGYEPTLYRSPSWELNRRSPEILVRHGVRSDSSLMDDEVPYALETPAGPLIEVPIQWALDDAEFWMHSRVNRDKALAHPDTAYAFWRGEFDGMYRDGACYVLTLHPFISGRHALMKPIERLIKYISGFPGVWWTTVEAVTRHAETLLAHGELARRASPPPVPLGFDEVRATWMQ
jgi:peptidoglycan/xylan/chitin deacetylase (PgdA/CDA1 family)